MNQIRDKHAEDLKRERERTELRVKETARIEIRNDIANEMTLDFSQEMQKTKENHIAEVQELKRQLEEISHLDRSLHMPRRAQMEEAEV